jgi:hypothetical protein
MSHGDGVYEQIFAGAESLEDVRRAIARAVRELRQAMEKEDNPAVMMAHMRSLNDIHPEDLARAYKLAERNCVFWPSPGQIREFAGSAEMRESSETWEWVLRYLEEHGADGRPRGGAVTFGNDRDGRRVALGAAPVTEAPQLPRRIAEALRALGGGSIKHGLLAIAQHPRIKGWDEPSSEPATKTAERIERQWMRFYRQASEGDEPFSTSSRRMQ